MARRMLQSRGSADHQPRKDPTRMRQQRSKRQLEPRHLQALAYNDAVRDILRADGVFKLSDRRRDTIWEWDGVSWRRLALVAPPLHDATPLPFGEDEAVASAT
jgi:hypothetical protein